MWWLACILLILPFQQSIANIVGQWNTGIVKIIYYLDEITIVILFPFALREFYRKKDTMNISCLYLLLPITVFIIIGLISGSANGNSMFITILGSFDYIKNFLVIFIYAAFFCESDNFKKIFRLLLIVAVFLGAIAFIQESWALFSRYVIGKGITDPGIYILRKTPTFSPGETIENIWRYGIYRTPTFMAHPNNLGLYCLLIYIIYFYSTPKKNLLVLCLLLSGIFVSVSRTIYAGFMLLLAYQTITNKKLLLTLAIIALVTPLIFLNILKDKGALEYVQKITSDINPAENESVNHRAFTTAKSLEIWENNPLIGVGPGMFGGQIAKSANTHLYDEYNFGELSKEYTNKWGLDQFWFKILAETGIIGTAAFTGLLLSLLGIFIIRKKQAASDEMKGLFEGLSLYIAIIIIYLLGSGFNMASVIFTFFSLVGLGFAYSGSYEVKDKDVPASGSLNNR
jgi:hypothetical protein